MAEMNESSPNTAVPVDEDQLRQRLLRRIGLAGVVIVALISSLAIFDAVFVDPPAPPPVAVEAAPVAVNPDPLPAMPAEPAEPIAATPTVEEKVAEAAPPPEAAKETPPPAAKPPANAIKEITKPAPRSEGKPAPVAAPERTAAPSLPPPPPVREPLVSKPVIAQPANPRPVATAPIRPLTGADEASRRYLVQMGVFSNVANAEELKARLDKAGIPTQIEARVQVGPFANKAEAEAAQRKMAAMGLNGLLVSGRK